MKTLTESSLSRIWQHSKEHDIGMISGNRHARDCGEGEVYTAKENKQRNKSLLTKLKSLRYSVTSVRGSYIENFKTKDAVEVGENSFLVVDINDKGALKKDLIKLGLEFEQDSILFKEKGGAGVLIGSNKCSGSWPGWGKESKQGGAVFGASGEFMSRVNGRPFVFKESEYCESFEANNKPNELRSLLHLAEKHWSEMEVEKFSTVIEEALK